MLLFKSFFITVIEVHGLTLHHYVFMSPLPSTLFALVTLMTAKLIFIILILMIPIDVTTMVLRYLFMYLCLQFVLT